MHAPRNFRATKAMKTRVNILVAFNKIILVGGKEDSAPNAKESSNEENKKTSLHILHQKPLKHVGFVNM